MKFVCPNCEKMIFNRRLANCEFCNEKLPAHLLFSDSDKQRLYKEYSESQVLRSRERRKSDNVPILDESEPSNIIHTCGIPIILPRSSRECIKCGLTISQEFDDCPHCYGKGSVEIEHAKATFEQNQQSSFKIGRFFLILTFALVLFMVGLSAM